MARKVIIATNTKVANPTSVAAPVENNEAQKFAAIPVITAENVSSEFAEKYLKPGCLAGMLSKDFWALIKNNTIRQGEKNRDNKNWKLASRAAHWIRICDGICLNSERKDPNEMPPLNFVGLQGEISIYVAHENGELVLYVVNGGHRLEETLAVVSGKIPFPKVPPSLAMKNDYYSEHYADRFFTDLSEEEVQALENVLIPIRVLDNSTNSILYTNGGDSYTGAAHAKTVFSETRVWGKLTELLKGKLFTNNTSVTAPETYVNNAIWVLSVIFGFSNNKNTNVNKFMNAYGNKTKVENIFKKFFDLYSKYKEQHLRLVVGKNSECFAMERLGGLLLYAYKQVEPIVMQELLSQKNSRFSKAYARYLKEKRKADNDENKLFFKGFLEAGKNLSEDDAAAYFDLRYKVADAAVDALACDGIVGDVLSMDPEGFRAFMLEASVQNKTGAYDTWLKHANDLRDFVDGLYSERI